MAERAPATSKKPEAKQTCSNSCKQKPGLSPSRSPADRILQLQRTAGNQAVQRLIKSGALQAKLRIGQPNDVYEQEADRVAEQIMSMPEPHVSNETKIPKNISFNHVQRKCPGCKLKKEEEEKIVQAKEISGSTPEVSFELESSISEVRGGGQPLPESTRAFFEPRFGHDFSEVRVYNDAKAAESAQKMNAKAFTLGRNIVFGSGEYEPEKVEGRKLLAHELAHVVQQAEERTSFKQLIQRQQAAGNLQANTPGAQVKGDIEQSVPRKGAERVWYRGVMLASDRDFMRGELRRLIAQRGLKGAGEWHSMLLGWKPFTIAPPVPPAHLGATGALRPRTPLDVMREEQDKVLQQRLAPLASEVYVNDILPEAMRFIEDFEKQAKANVSATLTTSEVTAKKEAVRYGMTEEQVLKMSLACTKAGVDCLKTKYHMQTGTPVTTGLQKAAGVLLTRREEIEKMKREQLSATRCEYNPLDPSICLFVPDEPKYSELGLNIKAKRDSYMTIRNVFIAEYPVLAAVSEPDEGTSELRTIKEKGARDETANIIGALIADRLEKINKVRANLNDKSNVNVWRLPRVVDITSVQLGAHSIEFKKRIVADKVEEEKPGILGDILLSIFNLLAVALAPATLGISLAVAAGVNIVATGFEVKEHMMKKALSGHTFDRARALSQDEPSLFWLAMSIVGTVFDVQDIASAIKIFRNLAPLAKAAKGAKSAKEAEKETEKLLMAARNEGGKKGEELAKSVKGNLSRTHRGESLDLALEASGATPNERKALKTASDITKAEAEAPIGSALRTAFGEVRLSKSGHCLICSSPCAVMREKYAEAFVKNHTLLEKLEEIESRARKAVKLNGPDAEKMAEAVKHDLADLEKKIREAYPDLVPKSPIVSGERFIVKNGKDIDYLRANPPSKPSHLDDAENRLWDDYMRYYNDRLSTLEAQIKSHAEIRSEPPRTWESYLTIRQSRSGELARGRAHQARVTESMSAAKEFLTLEDVGLSRVFKSKRGQVKYTDQLIMDNLDFSLTAVSNKSRNFKTRVKDFTTAELNDLRDRVRKDVQELFEKYSGDLYIKRKDHPLYGKQVSIREVILVYENAPGLVSYDLARIIISEASTEARAINPDIAFHVTLQ